MSNERLPASIRNRNPGAQQPGPVSKRFGATSYQTLRWKDPKTGKTNTNTIATFPTDIQGGAALFYLLASPAYANGQRTIREAITKWCGGYYVSTYMRVLQEQAGIGADAILTRGLVCNPDVAIPLAKAMAWQEAGRAYPMSDADWHRAHVMALPDAQLEVTPVETVAAPPEARKATDVEGWDRSMRSSPEQRVKEAARESWTLKGSVMALIMWFWAKIEGAYEIIASALDMAQSAMGPNTPIGFAASVAKANTVELLGFLMAGGILIVIARRFKAAEEGKTG